ncbi:EPIDERMAL PATTERNING FACTOR-like protein 1 [Alnus glutinosa]|uniref:EPIDERMAL PATTERNING FACTOR-like protein 1 n=1 Tax=Alnus glutinosa TaxID=3517 RepID=UPI002D7A3F18|nr:EPIDERMAL PATTERNING FACTOR-like protein 1 [Alnus glutinosa]
MTVMNSINSYLLRTATLVIVVLYLISPASGFNQQQQPPSSSHRGLLFEEKSRLGSTPPSCHNKCNECHPCMAVQVPTMPSQPGLSRLAQTAPTEFFDQSPRGNRYSNYKPLGWKCRCQDRLFNP